MNVDWSGRGRPIVLPTKYVTDREALEKLGAEAASAPLPAGVIFSLTALQADSSGKSKWVAICIAVIACLVGTMVLALFSAMGTLGEGPRLAPLIGIGVIVAAIAIAVGGVFHDMFCVRRLTDNGSMLEVATGGLTGERTIAIAKSDIEGLTQSSSIVIFGSPEEQNLRTVTAGGVNPNVNYKLRLRGHRFGYRVDLRNARYDLAAVQALGSAPAAPLRPAMA